MIRLHFLKEIVLAQRLFGRSNRDAFLENEGKIHEGGCVKNFLVNLQVGILKLCYRLTYSIVIVMAMLIHR